MINLTYRYLNLNKNAMQQVNAHEFNDLITQVASIERQTQPYAPWNKTDILDLLTQPQTSLLLALVKTDDQIIDGNSFELETMILGGFCLYQKIYQQADILRIATALKWQRQNIASGLIEHLKDMLKQQHTQSIILEVRADNLPAVALYKKQRFKQIHIRKNYYQLSDQNNRYIDALIMQCDL